MHKMHTKALSSADRNAHTCVPHWERRHKTETMDVTKPNFVTRKVCQPVLWCVGPEERSKMAHSVQTHQEITQVECMTPKTRRTRGLTHFPDHLQHRQAGPGATAPNGRLWAENDGGAIEQGSLCTVEVVGTRETETSAEVKLNESRCFFWFFFFFFLNHTRTECAHMACSWGAQTHGPAHGYVRACAYVLVSCSVPMVAWVCFRVYAKGVG